MSTNKGKTKFPKNLYYQICILGSGAFGKAYLYMVKETGNFRVIKKVGKIPQITSNPQDNYFQRECAALGLLSHYCIVKLYSYGEYQFDNWLEMEYVPNGTLLNYINTIKDFPGPTDRLRLTIISYGIAAGLAYTHKKGIIHRDIKPDNILLNEELEPKIGDFGFARDFNELITSFPLTLCFAAPEVVNRKPTVSDEVSYKSDVYSFGVTLFCLLTKFYPNTSKTFPEYKNQVEMDENDPFTQIVNDCTKEKFTERPTMEQIKNRIFEISKTLDPNDQEIFNDYVNKVEHETEPSKITIDQLEDIAFTNPDIQYILGLIYNLDLRPHLTQDIRTSLIYLYDAIENGCYQNEDAKNQIGQIYKQHKEEIDNDPEMKRIVDTVL